MPRPLRIEFEGAIYHLCARGNARQLICHDERDRARFVELLDQSAQRFDAAVLYRVLMGNHFSSGGENASAQSAEVDALAVGFLHGLF